MTPFLAVDWGTTNRRTFRIGADGAVEAAVRDGNGILAVGPGGFAAEAAAIRAELGDLPILCAGMVGSNRGWVEAPYVDCPAGLDDLSAALVWAEPGRTAIVPGLSVRDPADVMRGEEVQVLGAVAAGIIPADALVCQPGTHSKWARLERGRIAGFTTAMTGELFALLKRHSLLAAQLEGAVTADAAFLSGVAEGARRDLPAALFGVRAAALLGERAAADSAAYTSGLLIGADVAARIDPAGAPVHILADAALGTLYAATVRALGGSAILADSEAAFIAGAAAIWKELP